MPGTALHTFVSAASDGADATLVRPSSWNAVHKGLLTVINAQSDYGAVGDGTTDDTTAIQNALNAVPAAGGAVFLPRSANPYIVTSVTVKSNTLLCGEGPAATVLKLKDSSASSTRMVTVTQKSNVVIRDLGFDGNKANQAADATNQQSHCVMINQSTTGSVNVRVERCDFTNASGDAIFVYGPTVAAQITNVILAFNRIIGTRRQGISLGGCQYVTVIGNQVLDGGTAAGEQGGGIHIEADDDGMPARDITIVGNLIRNAVKGAITCGGNNTGTAQANFQRVVISGNTIDGSSDTNNGAGIEVNGFRDVTISGNTVRNARNYGIFVRSSDVAITGNAISESYLEAIVLSTVTGSTVLARINVTGNTIERSNTGQVGPFGTIRGYTLIDSVIANNIIYDVGGANHGIWVSDALRNAIGNNTIRHSAAGGSTGIIESGTSDSNTIVGNIVSNFGTVLTTVGAGTKAAHNFGSATHTA